MEEKIKECEDVWEGHKCTLPVGHAEPYHQAPGCRWIYLPGPDGAIVTMSVPYQPPA
jgi:hypothetical protein